MLNSFPPYTVHIVCISSSFFAFYIFPSVSLFSLLFLSVCMIFFSVGSLDGWCDEICYAVFSSLCLYAACYRCFFFCCSFPIASAPFRWSALSHFFFVSFIFLSFFLFPFCDLFVHISVGSSFSLPLFFFLFLFFIFVFGWLLFVFSLFFSTLFFFGKSLVYKNFALGLKSYRNEQQQQQRQRHKQ